MLSTVKVYERNREKFRSAENDYTLIDELADKLIHETGGNLTRELARKTLKGIVESMDVCGRTGQESATARLMVAGRP